MPKISELTAITSITTDDLVMVVNDPSGSPSTNKITVGNFANSVTTQLRTANTTSSGVIKVGENLTSNSTGFLNVSGTAALPSSGKSEGFVVTWDATTNAAIWQAFSGVRDLHLVDSANTYSVAEHDNIIFANPNSISNDIEIVLPDGTSTPAATTGKTYFVKNLNPGDGPYRVRVITYSGKQSSSNILESPTTGNFVVYHDITAKGDEQGWIFDGSVWRHFGSQTGLPVFTGNANTFSELSVQNISSGANASADVVAYNNIGEPVTGDGPYVDMGINSSTYNNPTYSINGPSDSYLYNIGGDLTIGTANTGTSLILHAGGTTAVNARLVINSTAIAANTNTAFVLPLATKANNSVGIAGQISWDSNNIYICVGTNSWKKATLSDF